MPTVPKLYAALHPQPTQPIAPIALPASPSSSPSQPNAPIALNAPLSSPSPSPYSSRVLAPDPRASAAELDAVAHEAARERFGDFVAPDGSTFHPDRQPLAPGQYHAAMSKILTDGDLSSLNTPEADAWNAAGEDRAARLALAQAAKSGLKTFTDAAGRAAQNLVMSEPDPSELAAMPEEHRALPPDSELAADALRDPATAAKAQARRDWRIQYAQTRDEDNTIADYSARIASQNWLAQYETMQPDLTPEADAIVRAAAKAGGGIPEEHHAAYLELGLADEANGTHQAEMVRTLARAAMPEAARNAWKEAALRTWDTTSLIATDSANAVAALARRVPIAPGQYSQLPQQVRDQEDLADPPETRLIRRKLELSYKDANARKPYGESRGEGYNVVQEAFIGAAAMLPYMGAAAVTGVPGMALQEFGSVQNRIVRAGGNPEEGLGAQVIFAAAYGAIEKLQLEGLVGKPFTDLQRRIAIMNLARSGYKAYLKTGAKFTQEAVTTALVETGEEMGQQAVEESDVGLNLRDPDTVKKTVSGFLEQANTIGTMALLGTFGAGKKAYTAQRSVRSREETVDFAIRSTRAARILADAAAPGADQPATPERIARHLNEARDAYTQPPSLAQGHKALTDLGYTPAHAAVLADYFDAERALSSSSRPRYLAEATTALPDPAAGLRLAFPTATIEPLSSQPIAPIAPPPASPADSPEPRATLTVKQSRNGRTITRTVPNPAHAEWLSSQLNAPIAPPASPASPTPPTRYRVTFPLSQPNAPLPLSPNLTASQPNSLTASYIIEPDTSAPDTTTPAYAASVQQATSGAIRADHYLAMSPDEQARVRIDNGLSHRGSFLIRPDTTQPNSLNAPLSPSSPITSNLLPLTSSALMRLVAPGSDAPGTQAASNLTLWHEHGHAVLQLAEQAGVLTPEHQATLAAVFGPGVIAGETYDQEAVVEGLARWIASQLDAPLPDPSGIFQKILAFINSILQALGLKEDPAVKTRREQAREAVYAAIQSGDFAGLSPYAGITFTDESKKPEVISNKSEPITPNLSPLTSTPDPAVESARAAASPTLAPSNAQTSPTSPSSPSPATLSQLATTISDPTYVAPQRITGPFEVYTPKGEIAFQVEYMWTPHADMVHSDRQGYDEELQNRTSDAMGRQEQIVETQNKDRYRGRMLVDSKTSDSGSPITVDPSITVEIASPAAPKDPVVAGGLHILAGNGRWWIIAELIRQGRYQAEYLDRVLAECAALGIPPPRPDMMDKHPILHRRIVSIPKGVTLEQIATLSNEPGINPHGISETAAKDAKRITPSILSLYSPGTGGNLLAASNRLFMRAFIAATGAKGTYDDQGLPTIATERRVQDALIALLIGSDKDARVLLSQLMNKRGSLGISELYNAIRDHAGSILSIASQTPTLSLSDHLKDAVARYIAWRSTDPMPSLDNHLSEPDFTRAPASPESEALMRLTAAGRLGPVLDQYAILARRQGSNTAGLGLVADRTPLQLLSLADRETLATGQQPSTPDPDAIPVTPPPAPSSVLRPPSSASLFGSNVRPIGSRPASPSQPIAPTPLNAPLPSSPSPAPASAASQAPAPAPVPANTNDAIGTPPDPSFDAASVPPLSRVSRIKTINTLPSKIAERLSGLWKGIMPGFQGNKREMSVPVLSAIFRYFTPEARDRFDTLVDYFGGGGNWGIFLSITAFPNIKTAHIYEINELRARKIDLFIHRGEQVAAMLADPTFVSDSIQKAVQQMVDEGVFSGSALSNRLKKISNLTDEQLVLVQALTDYAENSFATASKNGKKAPEFKAEQAIRIVGEQAAEARRGALEFLSRPGARVTIHVGEDSYKAQPIVGDNVLAVADPPYYKTKGYTYLVKVTDILGEHWEEKKMPDVGDDTYAATRDLLRRLATANNAIIYTDSAWGVKDGYGTQITDPVKQKYHDQKGQAILSDMLDILDRYDIVDGEIGKGRSEVLGVHHGNRNDAAAADAKALGYRRADAGSSDNAVDGTAQRPDPSRGQGKNLHDLPLLGLAQGDAGLPAPLRSGDDQLARHSITSNRNPRTPKEWASFWSNPAPIDKRRQAELSGSNDMIDNEDIFQHYFDVVVPRMLDRPVTSETRWAKGIILQPGRILMSTATDSETIGPWDHSIIWQGMDEWSKPSQRFTLWDGKLIWDGDPTRSNLEAATSYFTEHGLRNLESAHLYGGAITPQRGWQRPADMPRHSVTASKKPDQTERIGTFTTNEGADVAVLQLAAGGNLNTKILDASILLEHDGLIPVIFDPAKSRLVLPDAGRFNADHANLIGYATDKNPDTSIVRGLLDINTATVSWYDITSLSDQIMNDAGAREFLARTRASIKRNNAAVESTSFYVNGRRVTNEWEDIRDILGYSSSSSRPSQLNAPNAPSASPANSHRHQLTASRRGPDSAAYAEAYLTSRLIAGKPVTPAETATLLKNAGITADPATVLAAAQARAESSRATVLAQAQTSDADLISRLAHDIDRQRYAARISDTFAKGADYANTGTDAALTLERAREHALRRDIDTAAGYTAAEMQAELAIDLSAAVLATPDIQPTAAEIDARQLARDRARAAEAASNLSPLTSDLLPLPPSPTMTALLAELTAAAVTRAEADRLEAQRKALADKQRSQSFTPEGADASDTDPALITSNLLPPTSYQLILPALNNPEEFAAFVYEWATRRIRADRPDLDPAQLYRHPAAFRDLQRTAQEILKQLAQDLLGTGNPRLQAERDIAGIADTKTPRAVMRELAYIYGRIHAGALRTSREDQLNALERDIRRLAVEPGRFTPQREDLRRRVTAKVEVFSRTLISYMRLAPTQIEAEDHRLSKILADAQAEEDATGYAAATDTKAAKAADQLAVLRVYGGMIGWMPGQISDAAAAIVQQLSGDRAEFENARIERQERAASILARLTGGLMRGPSDLQPKPGWLAQFADANMGNLELRLRHAVRHSTGKLHEDALAAIQDLMVLIGEGETDLLNLVNEGRTFAAKALKDCYGSTPAGARRLDSPIPPEASSQLSRQGHALTYGQALQLYGQILQRDYAGNVRANGRAADLAVLRTVLDSRDLRFHQALVGFYRDALPRLSSAQQAVTGLPMLSTDAFYIPARLYLDPRDFPSRVRAWSPIPATLTPRIKNRRDFDERRDILGVFAEALDKNSRFLAWGQRGIALRDIVGASSFQGAIERFQGTDARKELISQITDILTGTDARDSHALDIATKARHWTSLLFMSGNASSMLKQLASLPAFANVVGFRRTARYLTSIDPEAVRTLHTSPGFRARYGTGWNDATVEILADHNRSLPAKILALGLTPIGLMDEFVSLWFGQGYYRDLRATFIDQGMAPDEAQSRALTLVTNIVEQTQQSGRSSNLTNLQRNGGGAAKLLLQFVTSPLQQSQFETAAIREFMAGTPGARARLTRALVINHLLIPTLLTAINSAFNALLGKPPPDDDDQWRDALIACVLGQYGSLFLVGAFAESGLTLLLGGKPAYGRDAGIPAASLGHVLDQAAKTAVTAARLIGPDFLTPSDLAQVTTADLLTDLDKLAQRSLPPYRHARQAYTNRQPE